MARPFLFVVAPEIYGSVARVPLAKFLMIILKMFGGRNIYPSPNMKPIVSSAWRTALTSVIMLMMVEASSSLLAMVDRLAMVET